MRFLKLLILPIFLLAGHAHAELDLTKLKAPDRARIEKALAVLGGTPTGRQVLDALRGHEITVGLEPGSNGSYDDEQKWLSLSPEAVRSWPEWKLARLLCHELTHAVQDTLGVNRTNYDNNYDRQVSSSGVGEFAALSMEVRFWVELGAPVDPVVDFYSLRREAYLFFPETVRVGWAYTNSSERFKEPVLSWSDERLASYWESVLISEAAWRASWAAKFPARGRDVKLAHAYLRERVKKPVSAWLPGFLENPAGVVPAGASALDRELIGLHRLVPDTANR